MTQGRRVTQPHEFRKVSPIACALDAELGVCVGWAAFSKKDGIDYVDAHGDHFPDAELFAAVDVLNRVPVEKRAINVEHEGPDRGVIVSAFALTEDFCKASVPKIDTGGTYGVLVTFKPDADLLKSIKAGEAVCLSIEGKAHDVETIAKSSSASIAATAHKRTMRKVELTALAVVKAGAHEGAAVAIVKGAPADPVTIWRAAQVAKRAPVLTSAVAGHQHLIADAEESDGWTSYETVPGAEYGHSHPFTRAPDGSITVGMSDGHAHEVPTAGEADMADDLTKSLTADLAKARALTSAVLALPAAELAYAKRLTETELAAYVAKSAEERAKIAAPVFVAKSGEAFYATDDARLVNMAKAHDAQAVELAKAKEAAAVAEFAKTGADRFGHLIGGAPVHTAIAKAMASLTGDERKAAEDSIAAASGSIAKLLKPIGNGGGESDGAGAEAQLNAMANEIAKTKGVPFFKAYSDALETPAGAALYARAEAERRAGN